MPSLPYGTSDLVEYEPGSAQDPNRTDHPYGYSIRERHDLIKAVHTLSEFCQRYREERDAERELNRALRERALEWRTRAERWKEAARHYRKHRCAVGTPVTEWEIGMGNPSPRNTLNEIVAWSLEQFPDATVDSTYRHLQKEMRETQNALAESDMEAFAVELADIIHLAAQGIARALDLPDADHIVRAKLAINKARQWGDPDEYGVVEHVREGE